MSGNQIHGKHALGARANKISQGILTVRFEMPFPIWCTHCPKPSIIGQGVRFNAEKKKIGNYYSSPIFSFRMKHVACGGWIEIHTDPKNTAYVVREGARKRDLGEDKIGEGDVEIKTVEEREAMRSNAFASLEGKVEDKERLVHSKRRLEELQDLSEQRWEDPYAQNKKLRKSFRVGRKSREAEAGVVLALQDKMSLGLDILPENEDDIRRAALIEFGSEEPSLAVEKAVSKPLFAHLNNPHAELPRLHKLSRAKGEKLDQERRKKAFVAGIRDNTRASMDPFLSNTRSSGTINTLFAGVKRTKKNLSLETEVEKVPPPLVEYNSD